MRLLATGRAADVFEHEAGRVLRRYREPGIATEREAAIMRHLIRHGFPVPEVHQASGPDLVMERVEGPTMMSDLTRRPWRVAAHARTLAELHDRLHAIEPPPRLEAPLGEGRSILHMDLHPENVLMSGRGPVVIDWSAVVRGQAAVDVAHTWIVLATAEAPGSRVARAVAAAGRGLFLDVFLRHVDRRAATVVLPAVAMRRLADPHQRRGENEAVRKLVLKVAG